MNSFFTFHNVLMTLNYLGKIKHFIQVGAHDGQMHDPLRPFIINNNWTGLLIEPQIDMYHKCIKNYRNKKNITFVNVALHPTESTISLYKVADPKDYSHTGWASVNPNRFENTIYKDNYIEEKVHSMHLMDVIKKIIFIMLIYFKLILKVMIGILSRCLILIYPDQYLFNMNTAI